jgi:hypothetical protein
MKLKQYLKSNFQIFIQQLAGKTIFMENDIICWWSGGVTSAVSCKIAIDIFGIDRCRFIMIDTKNEDDDTYRFLNDCEKWYGKKIEIITAIGEKYNSIQEVWKKHLSLNVANGAICSNILKRKCREDWQKTAGYEYQIFGFEFDKKEFNRAIAMKLNHPKAKSIYPLLLYGYDKKKCIEIIEEANIEIPKMYQYGFENNNCFKTGCVQGGIGYWQKMKIEFPDKFNAMAEVEHELTNLSGLPKTMLKDQSEEAKKNGNELVFLKKHPNYPHLKCIDDMKGFKVQPLFDCNGLCGLNDLEKNETENQINYQLNLFD